MQDRQRAGETLPSKNTKKEAMHMKPLYSDWGTTQPKDCLHPGERIDKETLFHFRNNANADDSFRNMIQMQEVADIIGNQPIFDTIYKENECTPWIYAGQCYAGEKVNRNPALMPMVYICSRYRADTREQLETNIKVAKWAAYQAVKRGQIPIAPHLYFPRFMDDSMPQERYFDMQAGKRLMDQCSTFHIITVENVISEGMAAEIDYMTDTLLLTGQRTNFSQMGLETVILSRLER